MTDVFISYSRKDSPFVKRLNTKLAEQERDVWVDWEDIPLSTDWWREICEGIEKTNTFIFTISPDSMTSHICHLEINYAIQCQKRLLPIIHRDVDPELFLAEIATSDISPLVHDMLDGRNLMDIVQENWKSLAQHNWLYSREEDDFQEVFAQLIETIKSDLPHVREHTRLLVRAREWEISNQDVSLLLRGAPLAQAQDWLLDAENKEPGPSMLHREFIGASQEHEIEELAQQLKRQRRITQASAVAGVVIVGLLLLAVVFGFQSEGRRRIADENAATATIAQGDALFQANTAVAAEATSVANAAIAIENAATATIAQGEALYQAATAEAAFATSDANALIAQENAATATIAQGDALYQAATAVAAQATSDANAIIAQENAATATIAQGDALYQAATAIAAQATSVANAEIAQQNAVTATLAQGDALYQAATAVAAQSTSDANAVLAADNAATADSNAVLAESNAATAVAALEISEVSERLARAQAAGSTADQLLDTGNVDLALPLALEAAALNPELIQAQSVLDRALNLSPVLAVPDSEQASFSPDGSRLLTVNNSDFSISIWDIATRQIIHQMQGHTDTITQAGYSPDGHYVVSTSDDTSAVIWDAATGQELHRLTAHDTALHGFAISPDSTRLVTSADWNTKWGEPPLHLLVAWDIVTGERVTSLNIPQGELPPFTFSPDGRYFHMLDRASFRWDTLTGDRTVIVEANLNDQNYWIAPRFMWKNGHPIYGALRLYDAFTGQEIRQVINGFNWFVDDALFVAVSPDSRTLLVSVQEVALTGNNVMDYAPTSDRRLVYYDIVSNTVLATYENKPTDGYTNAVFTNDNTTVLSTTPDYRVVLWDAPSGDVLRTIGASNQSLTNLGLSSDERYALFLAADGSARVYDTAEQATTEVLRIPVAGGAVNNIAYSQDNAQIFANAGSEWVTFDTLTGEQSERYGLGNLVNDIAFHPTTDEALISIAMRQANYMDRLFDRGGRVLNQHIASATTVQEWGTEGDMLCSVAYSSDGTQALFSGELWDLENQRFLRTVEPSAITTLRENIGQSSQYDFIYECVCAWPLPTSSWEGSCIEVPHQAFSPDNGTIAVSSRYSLPWQILEETSPGSGQYLVVDEGYARDIDLRLLDATTGEEIIELEGYVGAPTRLAFSPDGTTLVAGITEPGNVIMMWDVATGEILRRFIGHTDSVNDVVFSPDSLTLLSASDDGSLILWDAATGQPIRRYTGHNSGVQRVAFRSDGQQAISTDGREIIIWDIASLEDLITWVNTYRDVQTLTCAQRDQYNIRPLCSEVPPTLMPSPTPTIMPTPFLRGVIVGNGDVNVRQYAGANASVVGTVAPGATVEVLTIDPAWYQIVLPDGQVGWVARNFLDRE